MGKHRRQRTRFHLPPNQKKDENKSTAEETKQTEVSGFNIDVPENIFDNVKIDLDDLNKHIVNDDAKSVKSVRSISKSVKSYKRSLGDVHMKKNDKMSLRRDLFLKKIQMSHEHLNRGKHKKGSNLMSISEMDQVLPSVDMVFHKPKNVKTVKDPSLPPASSKIRGILKAKDRRKTLIKNMEGFQELFNNSSFKAKPLDALTNCIQEKVFNGEL